MQSQQPKRCASCLCRVYKLRRYNCCLRSEYLCPSCVIKKCDQCQNSSKMPTQSRAEGQYPKKSYQRDYTSSIFRRKQCKQCSETISSLEESFEDTKCNMTYCYGCLLAVYIQQQDQDDPSEMVYLPCKCSYPQKEIIAFLRKACFVCAKSIGSFRKCYQLRNSCLVEGICYRSIERRGSGSYSLASERKALEQIEELIARCTGCGDLISEIGSKMEDIYLCRPCLMQMEAAQSSMKQQSFQKSQVRSSYIERNGSPSKNESPKLPRKPSKEKKKECLICSRIYPMEADSLDICRQCATSQYIGEHEVLEEPFEEVSPKLSPPKEPIKSFEELAQQQGWEEEQNDLEEVSKEKDRSRDEFQLLEDMSQLKNEEKQEKQPEVPVEPYNFSKVPQQIESIAQCSQCQIRFPEIQLLSVIERVKDDLNSLRIDEDENSLLEDKLMYCQNCYLSIKFSIQETKKAKENEKNMSSYNSFSTYGSRSAVRYNHTSSSAYQPSFFSDKKEKEPLWDVNKDLGHETSNLFRSNVSSFSKHSREEEKNYNKDTKPTSSKGEPKCKKCHDPGFLKEDQLGMCRLCYLQSLTSRVCKTCNRFFYANQSKQDICKICKENSSYLKNKDQGSTRCERCRHLKQVNERGYCSVCWVLIKERRR